MITIKPPPNAQRQSLGKYRSTHRRIDYIPSAEALAVIDRHFSSTPGKNRQLVIDHLVLAGDRALSADPTLPETTTGLDGKVSGKVGQ